MNIQGTNASTSVQSSSQQSDPRLKALDQQISNLRKSIQDVRKNEKLDQKSKEEKIKEYEQQIQLLQQEKAQIQAEGRQSNQKTEESKQSQANHEEKGKNNVVNEHVQDAFVQMDSLKKTEKTIGFVREQTKGELRIAESKSYLRQSNPAAAAQAREKLAKLDRTVLRKAAGVSENFSKAAEEPAPTPRDSVEEESDREYATSGTGRREPGQFLDDEA